MNSVFSNAAAALRLRCSLNFHRSLHAKQTNCKQIAHALPMQAWSEVANAKSKTQASPIKSHLYCCSRVIVAATMSLRVTLQFRSAHAVLQRLWSVFNNLLATAQSQLLSNANAQMLVKVHHAIAQGWSETFNRRLRASLTCRTNASNAWTRQLVIITSTTAVVAYQTLLPLFAKS